jgi:predicted glycogen debranching enzyme
MPTLIMSPGPGSRLVGFIGDRVRFTLRCADQGLPPGWRGMLRTNLGRASSEREVMVATRGGGHLYGGASWRDIQMERQGDEWFLELSLNRVGYFRIKPYAVDQEGKQHWPHGDDIGVSIHPDVLRTANTVYCAFVRAFGASRTHRVTRHGLLEDQCAAFDHHGYTLIPPSGTLRDLTAQIPHIVDTLGCRIIHLLPVGPTPTTHARMGRFGSPYAALDLTGIDPALVVFDQRTTGVDQFRELTYAAHLKGAQVFIDLAINHTGWASRLLEEHPEWFMRNPDGSFKSPGAWGVTWGDLVELEHQHNTALWEVCADAFLTWCRRGVDGFRCDAGYMVPQQAWQYITARVRQEFPDTVFLLEGLGGPWSATESLLTEGGMQWAYSELFQNYSGREVATYLDHAHRHSARVGVLVHYSETHDNDRLAKGGKVWSLLRNRLSALTSSCGAYGFTCGVEWLASEKIDVHECRGLNWGARDNIVDELGQLTRLVNDHPCFFDGARLTRLSGEDAQVYILRRDSAEGLDHVLVLANLDVRHAAQVRLTQAAIADLGATWYDLLLPEPAVMTMRRDGETLVLDLAPGECRCLSPLPVAQGLAGDAYRRGRACAAWGIWVLSHVLDVEHLGPHDWRDLAQVVHEQSRSLVGCIDRIDRELARRDLMAAIAKAIAHPAPPKAAAWSVRDLRRITPVPHEHALLIHDTSPFSITLTSDNSATVVYDRSVPVTDGHVACVPRPPCVGDARLLMERFADEGRQAVGRIRFLAQQPQIDPPTLGHGVALLTNGIGGMARIQVDLGTVASKYDCLLGANLHPRVPCDRHVLAKRVRVWVDADGFITPLDAHALVDFTAGPPATWTFVANAGDRRTVTIRLEIDLLEGRNTAVLRFSRPPGPSLSGLDLPDDREVALTVRLDLEDRSFHTETTRSDGAEHHFIHHTALLDGNGFRFAPASDRQLRVRASSGSFFHEPEWCTHIPHAVEAGRGQVASGDAWSPGWFRLPMPRGGESTVVACADADEPPAEVVAGFAEARAALLARAEARAGCADDDRFGRALARAVTAYVVRRDELKTVIAGYPWFLDWGRDSLIAARGLIAAGMLEEVRDLLIAFGRFEQGGTLPNCIHGEDASNRDTVDAPLWYGVVCEELAEVVGAGLYRTAVDGGGRTIADVLLGIAGGYLRGTVNGIHVDRASALVFSPSHFTWMDTNHPPCTPREGYPIEIQVLWIRLLRQLHRLGLPAPEEAWSALAGRALEQLGQRFWIEERGYYADLLIAKPGQGAHQAVRDNALRSNQVLVVAMGLVGGERARRTVVATARFLLVPGALRSLAPLPIDPPLPIHGADGRLLNHPLEPYWGRYEGDEDTRRKPAYHNGTAWTWTFPAACEAVARGLDFAPDAVATARAYLASMDRLLAEGCHGHLPEIVDGDAPHTQRGCDAQAWSATEALRVWKLLSRPPAG